MNAKLAVLATSLALLLTACGDDSTTPLSSDKAIIAFGFPLVGAPGIIDETDHLIGATVTYGIDVSALTPEIEYNGVGISPEPGTPQDFNQPVVYRVTAADGSQQAYVVYVNQGAAVATTPIAGNIALSVDIVGLSAKGGGTIVHQGASPVTERGLCWSQAGSPTLADARAVEGAGTGTFSGVALPDLMPGVTYYVRAYATNAQGTAYGNVVTVNAGREMGSEYGGGFVFYNDGYGGGLICGRGDLSSQPWSSVTNGLVGGTGAAVGTGLANSTAIVAQAGHTASPARTCLDYTDGIYDDWYLPSASELLLIHTKLRLAGLGTVGPYTFLWSSTEASATDAYYLASNGNLYPLWKTAHYTVRAVRSFQL